MDVDPLGHTHARLPEFTDQLVRYAVGCPTTHRKSTLQMAVPRTCEACSLPHTGPVFRRRRPEQRHDPSRCKFAPLLHGTSQLRYPLDCTTPGGDAKVIGRRSRSSSTIVDSPTAQAHPDLIRDRQTTGLVLQDNHRSCDGRHGFAEGADWLHTPAVFVTRVSSPPS